MVLCPSSGSPRPGLARDLQRTKDKGQRTHFPTVSPFRNTPALAGSSVLAQVREGLGNAPLSIPDEFQVKEIFPRAAAQRSRLHLGQVDVPQGEDAETLIKGAGGVGVEKTIETSLALRETAAFLESRRKRVKFS